MPIQLAMPIAHVMFQSFMCHEIALIVAVPISCSCHSYGGVCGKRQLHAQYAPLVRLPNPRTR